MAQALCVGRTRLFFAGDQISQQIAVAVCRRCPVQPDCERRVRATEEGYQRAGVVAGFTAEERRGWGDEG